MIKTKRRENCLNELLKTDLDGLLFATSANFQYLTESKKYFWQRNCMNLFDEDPGSKNFPDALVYMNRGGDTTILTIPANKEYFDSSKNNIVISYFDQFEDELYKIVDGKKIGIGKECGKWLKKTLNNLNKEVCDAQTIFDDIRRIKDEEEINQLRKLAKFTDEAVMYVCNNLKEGMTMADAERLIVDYGLNNGIQDLSFPPTCGFKTRNTENAQNIEPFEPERKLVEGTMVAFDIGYMNDGYCSDWGRTVYYGKAPEFVKKGYEALQAAQQYMVSKIIPNQTRFGDLYGFICDKAEELGYYEYLRFKREEVGGNGHHIGVDCHEEPWLVSTSDLILKPGMVFCSEPKMFFPNEGYMRVEDMILITENGAEFLTKFPRDLFEL